MKISTEKKAVYAPTALEEQYMFAMLDVSSDQHIDGACWQEIVEMLGKEREKRAFYALQRKGLVETMESGYYDERGREHVYEVCFSEIGAAWIANRLNMPANVAFANSLTQGELNYQAWGYEAPVLAEGDNTDFEANFAAFLKANGPFCTFSEGAAKEAKARAGTSGKKATIKNTTIWVTKLAYTPEEAEAEIARGQQAVRLHQLVNRSFGAIKAHITRRTIPETVYEFKKAYTPAEAKADIERITYGVLKGTLRLRVLDAVKAHIARHTVEAGA